MEKKKKIRHEIKITPDHADGIYPAGKKAVFKVKYLRNGRSCPDQKLEAFFHHLDFPKRRKKVFSFLAGREKKISFDLQNPSSLILEVYVCGKNGKPLRKKTSGGKTEYISFSCGILASPEKCLPAADKPEDFEHFWEERKKELAQIPVRELEKVPVEVPEEKKGKFLAWDMKISCLGAMPVSGYLTIPADVVAGKRKVPVIVSYHGGGVRSSILSFNENAISFDVNAHGIVNGKDPSFYRELSRNELNRYIYRGQEDKNSFYFLHMYLRLLRAQEFVRTLSQWNKKDLILIGGSQGGGQALAGAGMDKNVTLVHAWVPALCNLNHYRKGRASSWPCSLYYCDHYGADKEKTAKCIPYFDAVNFARSITCEIFMATGLLDATCPPENVFAAYNVIPSEKKSIYTHPDKGHLMADNPLFPERLEKLLTGKK